jgi:membrane associated rhomboid family serine protease
VIPLSDENPTVRMPIATLVLMAAMGVVWVVVQGAGFDERTFAESICNWGLVPGEFTRSARLGSGVPITPSLACMLDANAVNWASPATSIFLHGSWFHLGGNALFFWVFGNNVEDVMGRGRFVAFFFVCGLAAAAAHVLMSPASPVPTVGASGAVSGVMGAYLVLFPRVRVRMLFWLVFIVRIVPIPAWIVLVWWFALQLIGGLPDLQGVAEPTGGVAFWAHVGGFVAGALLIRAFEKPELVEARRAMLLQRGLLRAI